MARRVGFSGLHPLLADIADHHQDLLASLRLYFNESSPEFTARFAGYIRSEVSTELSLRIDEIDMSSSLAVLTSLEATFRIDYLQRCYMKDKSPISRHFRGIYRRKRQRASLEDDIFAGWVSLEGRYRPLIGELRGAFRFRHWLAHGRYWTPKLGRRYDYSDVFTLGEETLETIPFYGYDG